MAGNDAYTVLLLHCDGADESTTFTDVSVGGSSHTVTVEDDAQVDTSEKEFGTGSCLLDGVDDWLSIPDHADFDFDADYTVDFWLNTVTKTTDGVYRRMYSHGTNCIAGTFDIHIDNSGYVVVNEHTVGDTITGTTDVADGAWHHVAVARSGSNTKLFIDGTQEGDTFTFLNDLTTAALVRIGEYTVAGTGNFAGWLDEIRVSKGIARWTSNFTAPTEAYSADVSRRIFMVT